MVLGFTIGGGIVAGIVFTVFERFVYNPFQYTANPLANAGVNIGGLIIPGFLFPVVQEAVKPLPPFFLPKRADFPETLDAPVFAIPSPLLFTPPHPPIRL